MKLVITSRGENPDSEMDDRFGRAEYFAVFDTESGAFSSVSNKENLNAAQGAGIQAGKNVIELGVEAVITGNIGPKAFATLESGHVAVYLSSAPTVSEAIELFRTGQLEPADSPNV